MPARLPFEKFDPALKRTYAGTPAGTGSISGWSGNRQAGEGRATITESRAGERIAVKREYIRPYAATNAVMFRFQPNGSQTVVTWRMTGKHAFLGKAFSLLTNTDKMCGTMFAEGLANLKRVAETPSVGA